MLQKWKKILTNWINCYLNEVSQKEQNVTIESLLSIISHLRENLNLDDSKSSKLDAHTVEEFIIEKYPEFKFENGTVEPTNEEEIYIVASLLLFFVCVISKDVDIKYAMCSKLSGADQELIMKFSKSLMACSPISYRDVQTSITEACGQEPASVETSGCSMVAETPPALRSLHGEVRRLQAALDAERFDRNYLQEELSRTNLKLEKLLKDKKQYKLDILNLKAKISLCCGQESESKGTDSGSEGSVKLLKQLQQTEEKLVETQGLLDDVQYERDTYKTKIDELKQERDKWMVCSQRETAHVSQLTEDLEIERRHVTSLRDLVTELRQHNQLNRMDTSQLECDDLDTSLHSAQNLSVCSEACANVVEVQLGEERAKIVVLKQQIDTLLNQLNDLSKRSENEKLALETIIFDKDNEVLNLKHRINELIEENNNLKSLYNDEVSKLNNDINELEQHLKDTKERSQQIIEAKTQDIQTLQEEKMSLLQSLSQETTKLDNVIKSLSSDLDKEKSAKSQMKEDYENHLMKLNEKVLNRNNELVELQNKIFVSSEQIEDLQSQLKKERKVNRDVIEKYSLQIQQITEEKTQILNILQEKDLKITELQNELINNDSCIVNLNNNIEELQKTNRDTTEKYTLELDDIKQQNLQTSNMLREKFVETESLQKELAQNKARVEELNRNIEDSKITNHSIIQKFCLKLEETRKEGIKLEKTLQDKFNEIGELQNKCTQNNIQIEELNKTIENIKTENENYSLELKELKEEKIQTTSILEHHLLEIEQLKKELTENKAYSKRCDQNVNELKTRNEELITYHNLELEQLKDEKIQVENNLKQTVYEIDELQSELMQNKEYLLELNNTVDEMKITHHDIVNTYKIELEQFKNDNIHLKTQLEQRVLETVEVYKKLQENNLFIEKQNKIIQNLKTSHEQNIEIHNCEIEQVKQEKIAIQNLLDEKDIVMTKMQSQFAENSECIDNLNQNIDNLKFMHENITLQLEQLKEDKAQTERELKQKQTELVELREDLVTNNECTENLKKGIHDLKLNTENIIHKYKLDLNSLKNEKLKTEEDLKQKISEIEELKNQITQNNKCILELNVNIDQLKIEVQTVTQKYKIELEQLVNEKVQVEKKLKESNTSNEDLFKTIANLKTSKCNVIEKYNLDMEGVKEERMQTANILEQKALKIEEIQNLLEHNIAYTEKLNKNIDDLKKVIQDITKKYNLELEQLKEERSQMSNLLQSKELEVTKLHSQVTQNKEYIEKLNNEIKTLTHTKQEMYEKHNIEMETLEQESKQNEVMLQEKISEFEFKSTQSILHVEELNNNLIQLKSENHDLLEKYNLMEDILQDKDVEIKNLHVQLLRSKESIQEMNNVVNKLNSTKQILIEKQNCELEHLKEETVHSVNVLQEKVLEIQELKDKLTNNKVATIELQKDIDKLNVANEDIIEKHNLELECLKEDKKQIENVLRQEVMELKEQLAQSKDSVEELNNDINKLNDIRQTDNVKHNARFEQFEQEKLQLENELQRKEDHITQMQVQLTQSNKVIEELDNAIIELKTTKQNMSEKHNLQLEQLKEVRSQTENILKERASEITKMQNQLTLKNENIQELNKIIEDLKASKHDISLQLETLKGDMLHTVKILEKRVLDTDLQNTDYVKHEEHSNEKTAKTVSILEQKLLEIVECQKQYFQKNYENLTKQHGIELDELRVKKKQVDEYLEQKVLQIEVLQKELAESNANTEILNKNIDDIKKVNEDFMKKYSSEMEHLKTEKELVENNLEQRLLEIKTLQKELVQCNANTAILNKNIDDVKTENEDIIKKYNSEMEQLKTEKELAENNLEQKILEIETLQKELVQCNANTATLNKNIDDVKTENEDIIKKYNSEIEQLKTDKELVENNLEQKILEIETLQKELVQCNANTAILNKNIDDVMTENEDIIKKYNSEIEQLKTEKELAERNLEQKVLEIKRLQKELTQSNANIETLNKNIDDLKIANKDIIKKNNTEMEQLKTEKELAENNLKRKILEIETLQKELVQCNANTAILNKNIDDVKAENEDIIKKYDSEIEQLETEKELAENNLEQKVLEIKTLQKELTQSNANIETLNKNIDNIANEDIIKKYNTEMEQLKTEKELAETNLKQTVLQIEILQKDLAESNANTDILNKNIDDIKTTSEGVIKKHNSEMEQLKTEKELVESNLKQKVIEIVQNKANGDELCKNINDLKVSTDDIIEKLRLELELCKEEKLKAANTLQEKILEVEELRKKLAETEKSFNEIKAELKAEIMDIKNKNHALIEDINDLIKQRDNLERITMGHEIKLTQLEEKVLTNDAKDEEISKLKSDNTLLSQTIEANRTVITNLEQLNKENQHLQEHNGNENICLTNKCSILEEYQMKAEKQLVESEKEIACLNQKLNDLNHKLEVYEQTLKEKDIILSDVIQEKDAVIGTITKELVRANQREILTNSDKTSLKYSGPVEKDTHAFFHCQVDNTSDLTHSSMDSIRTISDLEKIIHDKNRTITTLNSDIAYLKSLMADSENKLLDVTKELEVSKENCQQLSNQLKKIVQQKNEDIAELKKQVTKMSVTENRATQIIKVSAKYQAIILKRIAEIKNNTVLKELTNFGNSSGDNELRRSLNVGTITMEDLENFLETTDRHLKRCSEKQLVLQKERDRLIEVNRINESEIINLKKFLTELSVSFKTFNSIKDLYMQKFSKVVSIQRTVRRDILSLDGHITDATMCKLERGYAAVMQDLSECSMNMERWVERSISRTISAEKIKQAFTSDDGRASLASTPFQNTSLEIQLEELENSFQKLLEEVARAQKGEGAKDAQAITVMEVRAQYEDKLSRMKAKMNQLYHEQIAVFRSEQKQEISNLEKELQKEREKLAESSRAYEEHIRGLTTELWSVGEKFLMKKDEAEWLRRKRSGSLMSLQHVHSSGLATRHEETLRSDTHSLRSLPVNNNTNNKREGRGMHMSDEEGEVFDNRWLKELASTPRPSPPRVSGQRLSELRWRNSLCQPHLKSSYPAEMQFAPAIDEEDIKCGASGAGKPQRKEVGITAYKKPGPPTPSKQAGRLSATDSELRESLRVEADPQPSRKTSTPSRLRALFRSNRNETTEGTPRSKRLSIFRKIQKI